MNPRSSLIHVSKIIPIYFLYLFQCLADYCGSVVGYVEDMVKGKKRESMRLNVADGILLSSDHLFNIYPV